MDIVYFPDSPRPQWPQPVLALGNFDGLHRGHMKIIDRVRRRAGGRGGTPVAMTFDPHPPRIVRPDKARQMNARALEINPRHTLALTNAGVQLEREGNTDSALSCWLRAIDIFVLPSLSEALSNSLMEAMACGVPVVCTDTGAMTELCQNNRGLLANVAYSMIDVWGNSKRDFIDIQHAAQLLSNIMTEPDPVGYTKNALEYVRSRTWDIAVNQVDNKLTELLDGTQQTPKAEG